MAPGWTPFLLFIGALTALLIVLARLSAGLLRPDDEGESTGSSAPPTDPPGEPTRRSVDSPDERSALLRPEPVGRHGLGKHRDRLDSTDPEASHQLPTGDAPLAELSTGALLANVAVTQGAMGAMVLGAAWATGVPAAALGIEPVPGSVGLPAVATGLAIGVALWAANEAGARVADAIGVGYDESLRAALAPESAPGWLLLLGVILPTIAGAEEVLFRGALVGAASVGLGISPWVLAVVSSLAFALGHGAQGRAGVVVTGLLGFALAGVFVLTGSLLVVIVAHYLVNALEFVVHEGPWRRSAPARAKATG